MNSTRVQTFCDRVNNLYFRDYTKVQFVIEILKRNRSQSLICQCVTEGAALLLASCAKADNAARVKLRHSEKYFVISSFRPLRFSVSQISDF